MSSTILLPPKLKAGDRIRLVSPASTPTRKGVEGAKKTLEKLGLLVEIGNHAFDEFGFLAGTDEDRLADINDALRDPGVRAIIATMGGKGAYRIADLMDFAAARKDPKFFVGFSEITALHLALWKHCRIPGIHGAPWNAKQFSKASADSFVRAVMTTESVTVRTKPDELTAVLTTAGNVTGRLLGGNQDMVAIAAGWNLPSFDGAILLLEAVGMRLGHIDRQLTMLMKAGHLKGLKGVAVGQYTDCTTDATTTGHWDVLDVLRDRLGVLKVPILGGLPLGHGDRPIAIPLGTMATLDANAGTLVIAPAVQ